MTDSALANLLSTLRSRGELFGLIVSFTLLLTNATSLSAQMAEVKEEDRHSPQDFLKQIVRSSQAISEIRVGDCLDQEGRRPDEKDRIVWNEEFISTPNLRAGGHFVMVELKEKPIPFKDEFGVRFEKQVLSPSVEVGLDILNTEHQVNGKKCSGRLWASYRSLEVKEYIGFPQYQQYGFFGGNFSTSHWWDQKKRRIGLNPEQLAHLKPCQVMTRAVIKNTDTSCNFFSLPVDMVAVDGDVGEFCDVNSKTVKRVWSSFQSSKGETWLIWCRLGPNENSVTIRQCVVEDTLGDKGTFWTWKRKSPVESITRQTGSRHVISNLSFTLSEIVIPEQNPKAAWVHIAEPEMSMSDAAR